MINIVDNGTEARVRVHHTTASIRIEYDPTEISYQT